MFSFARLFLLLGVHLVTSKVILVSSLASATDLRCCWLTDCEVSLFSSAPIIAQSFPLRGSLLCRRLKERE